MKNCFNIIAMRKILLFVCLLGMSVLSYAQCVVTNLADNGAGSLRDAIGTLNGGGCAGSVTAQAGLTGTITLTSGSLNLFATGAKTIDLSAGDIIIANNNNNQNVISITGSNYTVSGFSVSGARENGINLTNASNNTIQNVYVYGSQKSGIRVDGGSGNTVINNVVGLTKAGVRNPNGKERTSDTLTVNPPLPIYAGIFFTNSWNAVIDGNTVSANIGDGIYFGERNNANTIIINNKIGYSLDGLNPVGNYGTGILVKGSSGVNVGQVGKGNFIAANGNRSSASNNTSNLTGHGVEIRNASGVSFVRSNFIGTNLTATSIFNAAGNKRFGNHLNGIYINLSNGQTVGGVLAGEGNVVGGNGYAFEDIVTSDGVFGVRHGIQIDKGLNNLVYGNYVGWYNENCLPNRQDAMSILGYGGASTGNKIGGATVGIPGMSNIFTGGKFGIVIQGGQAGNNDIYGNFIGTDGITGRDIGCAPEVAGIKVQSLSKNNKIGSSTVPNYIANINGNAIEIEGNGTNNAVMNNTIQGNVMTCNNNGITLIGNGNNNYGNGVNKVTINVPTSNANKLEGLTVSPTDRIDIYIADTCKIPSSSLCQNSGGVTTIGAQGLKWITSVNAKADTKFTPPNSGFWDLTITPAMKAAGLTLENAVITATEANGTLNTSQFNTCSYQITCDPPSSATITPTPATSGFCPGQTVTLTANALAGHQYTWYRNNVKVGGGSGSTNNTFIASQAGSYTVKIASILDTNNCALTSSARTVTAYTTPIAPAITGNTTVCTGTPVTYSVPNTFANYTWSITPNTNPVLTFTGQGTNQITVNYGTAVGTRTINLNVTNANGCPSTAAATSEITIRPNPTVGSASVSAAQICADGTLTMTGNTVNAWETGVWSGNSNIVQPAGSTNATVNLPAGSYTIKYTVSNGGTCVAATKDFPVKVDGVPTPSAAGADREVCSSSVTLSGNPVALPNTARWISDRPAVTFNDNTSPTATASGLPVGVTRFIWEVSNGVCAKSTDTVFVTRVPDLTVANAGIDQTICEGSPVTLVGSTPQAGETVLWENLDNEGTLSSTNTASTDVTGLMVTANYRYTVSNGVCSNSSDDVKVTVQQPATATFTDPLNYLKQTETAGASITANLPINYTGVFTKVIGVGNIIGPEITNGGEKSTSVNNLLVNGDSILVRWTLTDDLNVCPTTSDSALVIRAEVGSVTFTLDSICETNTYGVLNGSRALESYETGQWIAAESDDFDEDVPADPTRIIPNFSAGPGTYKYVYQITNNNTGESEKGTKTIVVSGVSSPAVILSPDAVICVDNYPLEAQAVAAGNVAKWSALSAATSTLTSTSALNPTIQNIPESNRVAYIWSVKNGVCPIKRDTVFVTRTKKLTSANPTVSSADSLCEGMIANVTGSLPDTTITPKERGVWSIVQGSGVLEKPNYFRTNISQLGVGENVIQYKIGNGVCTSDSGTVTIVIDEKPDSAIIVGSNALVICDDEYRLNAVEPSAGNGLWTTSNTAVGISAPDSSSTLVTNLPEGGEVTFTWTVSSEFNKCVNPSATVKITRSLDLTQADAGTNQIVCNGEGVKLTGTPKKSSETSEWSLVPANSSVSFSSATNSDSTRVIGLAVGVHKFYYTIKNGVCNDAIDSVTVDIKPLPTGLDITAASDTLVCFNGGSTGDFFATGTNASEFIWTLPSGASEQSASASKDQITVAFSQGTATQKIYVSALSEFNCASAGRDSLLVKRLVIPTPQVDQGDGSCPGIDNILSISNVQDGVTYTWIANPDSIKGSNVGDSITVVTPEEDYTVQVTASSSLITCSVSSPLIDVDVFELLTGVDISGLITDVDGVKCDSDDERFDSTRVLRASVTTNDVAPDIKYTWSHTYDGNTDFPPNNDLDSLYWSFSKSFGLHQFKVLVENNKCSGDLDSSFASITLAQSVPVDFNLSAVSQACEKDTAILGVRDLIKRIPGNRDKVIYDWYHNNYIINTDLEAKLGLYDSLEVKQQSKQTDPFTEVLNQDKTFKHYDTTYVRLIGGNQISYDNYKMYGVLGEKISVKATPEFCIIYDETDSTKGEFLLWDTITTTGDVVLSRPGADAAAVDLNSILKGGVTITPSVIDANGYVIEYDELAIDKVEDRFALYDVTDKGGVEPKPLIRDWYVIDENGDYSQADITSNKDVLAYPNPVNRPELITYRLVRGNGVCKDSNDVNVKINYLPWPPNAFSPNGDGVYDKFEITNVDKYEGTTVTIFNRWGTEIVKINDYHLEENWWDGTKGGEALPTGGYFYLIDFNNGTDPITGAISLIK